MQEWSLVKENLQNYIGSHLFHGQNTEIKSQLCLKFRSFQGLHPKPSPRHCSVPTEGPFIPSPPFFFFFSWPSPEMRKLPNFMVKVHFQNSRPPPPFCLFYIFQICTFTIEEIPILNRVWRTNSSERWNVLTQNCLFITAAHNPLHNTSSSVFKSI